MATALVLLMAVPGLALFYGGLERARNGCRFSCSVLRWLPR
jgi:ammonia channel protein AmtB